MTGRDLILYILSNGLEEEPVFKDGKFIGFVTMSEAAERNNVGVATVATWIQRGTMTGVVVKEGIYIPANCAVRGE